EERPAVRRVDGLPAKRAAEIGCDADVVGDAIAEAVAAANTPGQVVLAPGEEVAGNSAAITEILLVEEHAVVERAEDGLGADLDVAPGLLDTPPRDKVWRQILRGVEEGRVAEAGIRDVGRNRRAADCRRAGGAAGGRGRQRITSGDVGDLVRVGEERTERAGV